MAKAEEKTYAELADELRQLPAFRDLLSKLRREAESYFRQACDGAADASRDRLVSLLAKAEARIALLGALAEKPDA